MKKDTNVIPKGTYCYTYDENGKFQICPYWDTIKDAPEQYNGYCHYLEKGDLDLEQEMDFIDEKTKEINKGCDLPFPVSLLWDQVKECGINDDIEEDGI